MTSLTWGIRGLDESDGPIRTRRVVLILFVAWCAVTLFAVGRHEPWRDEADAWLLARDGAWGGFFEFSRYGGTPMLWYFVQAPFARSGLGYEAQLWIHWVIAALAMAIFLWRERLSLLVRAAFAFSFFGLFEYSVVARSYSLTLLFLWLACAAWSSRKRKPWIWIWIALLAQTNIPGIFFCGALGAVGLVAPSADSASWWRRPLVVAAIAGALVSFLFACWQVRPPEDGQKEILVNLDAMGIAMRGAFFPWTPTTTQAVLAGMGAGMLLLLLGRYREGLAVTLLVFFGFTLLHMFVHQGMLRHWGFLLVAILAGAWIGAEGTVHPRSPASEMDVGPAPEQARPDQRLPVGLVLALLPWVIEAAIAVDTEANDRFSNSTAMARYLRAHHLERNRVGVALFAEAVTPWLDKTRVYYPATDRTETWLPWNALQRRNVGMPNRELARRTANHWRNDDDVLLLLTSPLRAPERVGFQFVHAEAEETWFPNGEKLFLYRKLASNVRRPQRPPEQAPEPKSESEVESSGDNPKQ